MNKPNNILRQGDVLLTRVSALPEGCVGVPSDRGRIVLAYGEVTGHSHSIHDTAAEWRPTPQAEEVCDAAIARAKARLVVSPRGERYLEVFETVVLLHEEHTLCPIPPGIYKVPVQVEYSPKSVRRVED
jgi:hypothetical protein